MAKTRKKNVTPVRGRKPNMAIVKKSPVISHKRAARGRMQKSKNKNIKTVPYESPLKHLYHNGEQSNTQNQHEDTKVDGLKVLPEKEESKIEIHLDAEEQCGSVMNNNKKEAGCSSTASSSKTKRDAAAASIGTNSLIPVKKRKLNKSPLSRIREINQPLLAKPIDVMDESVICVDDLDIAPSNVNIKPKVNSEDIVVIDCNETLTSSETKNQSDDQSAMPTVNLIDSVIVLDDEPQVMPKTLPKPAEDCTVVWSSLPTTLSSPSTSTSLHPDILKFDKISLDTRGDLSNLKYLKNDNSNKKLVKKSPKVTKCGVKKLNSKSTLLDITKVLAKNKNAVKAVPKVTKTLVKKKSKGDLIFSASESKTKQTAKDGKPKKGTLREIVIDGSNVAMACTNNKAFSEKGIKMLIDYFTKKGHTVKVFVPQYRRARHYPLLEKWHDEGIVVFTPSRKVGNKSITSYDDRFILEYAVTCKGIVVSQDQFRDLYAEKAEYKDTIENRLLVPTFVGDYVMFPEDPLGRNGPSLTEFLKH